MTSVSGSGERILAILDLFTEARHTWHTHEMMEALGYSRPTLYRYLKTLKDAGYLASVHPAGFTLGPRVTELDYLMRRGDPLVRAGTPALERLARTFRGRAMLVRCYGEKLLCVASVVGSTQPLSTYPRGRPMPIGPGAISRAIVAAHAPPARRQMVERNLAAFAQAGVGQTTKEVLAELRAVNRKGTAVAHGEVTPGLVGIAAPIFAGERTPLGALALTREARGLTDARLSEIEDILRAEAAELSALFDTSHAARAAE